jgi:hypothetical protein
MPEHDNDRLEQFFKKAASKPDIAFNENDWQKLEARLDAMPPDLSLAKTSGLKIASAVSLFFLFVVGTVYWNYEVVPEIPIAQADREVLAENRLPATNEVSDSFTDGDSDQPNESSKRKESDGINSGLGKADVSIADGLSQVKESASRKPTATVLIEKNLSDGDGNSMTPSNTESVSLVNPISDETQARFQPGIVERSKDQTYQDLVQGSSATIAGKIKQKAGGQLPGAEEEGGRKEDAIVKEEYASGQTKHLVPPRLSLLLSLAPDFSSTSINKYTSPGGAFGAMLHYHIGNSWSVSAGVVKNQKKYTGDGEDYQPPKGYWKYYTNDVVPESIDGSCSVLEIPVMVQYTLANVGRSRFIVGAGASSYLMLSESYRYYFDQPNPGAKEGWDSQNKSRFLFNMINFTVGYERQIAPGLRLGIEPYMKIPIEEIGWSNLKLFSTGASFTLRYNLLRKKTSIQSPGPDPG